MEKRLLNGYRRASRYGIRSCSSGYSSTNAGAGAGAFACAASPQLGKIWSVGLESTRSCVEDSCIDGPCRERGEWTGDTLAVTLPILVATYADIAPIRMCLTQVSAACDHNGVITGNCPEPT